MGKAFEPVTTNRSRESKDMATSVQMPALGESVTEGTVTRWLKQEGDTVELDEPLLEVSTDKVDTEIPSPAAGVLTKIVAQEDDTVEVGGELAVIGDAGEDSGDGEAKAQEKPAEAEEEKPAEQPAAQPEPAAEEQEESEPEQEPESEPEPEPSREAGSRRPAAATPPRC
jgi:2-oxoglutarate dehydrogenase E2 component (dihydrolipoamide succinyltransferase)